MNISTDITIEDNQYRSRVDTGFIERALRHAGLSGIDGAPSGSWTVAIFLTRKRTISELHSAYFDDPSLTDVITFPGGEDLAAERGHLADIAICLAVADEQAEEAGHGLSRELAFLALHGLLHSIGYVDDIPDQRDNMLKVQDRLLRAFELREANC